MMMQGCLLETVRRALAEYRASRLPPEPRRALLDRAMQAAARLGHDDLQALLVEEGLVLRLRDGGFGRNVGIASIGALMRLRAKLERE